MLLEKVAMIVIAVTLLIASGVCWFLVPMLWRKVAELFLADVCRRKRAIVLTFDDGPGKTLTTELLNLLRQYNVRASFFFLGARAAEHRSLVELVISEGHDVASHSQNHLNAWKSSPLRTIADIRSGIRTIDSLGGRGNFYRPTYGKLSLGVLWWAVFARLKLCWWTVDTRDSWAPRSIEDVVAQIKEGGGGVVLMHDFETYTRVSGALANDRSAYVLKMTQALITFAQLEGFALLRMSDLIRT